MMSFLNPFNQTWINGFHHFDQLVVQCFVLFVGQKICNRPVPTSTWAVRVFDLGQQRVLRVDLRHFSTNVEVTITASTVTGEVNDLTNEAR